MFTQVFTVHKECRVARSTIERELKEKINFKEKKEKKDKVKFLNIKQDVTQRTRGKKKKKLSDNCVKKLF